MDFADLEKNQFRSEGTFDLTKIQRKFLKLFFILYSLLMLNAYLPRWASRLALASIFETFLLSKYEYLVVSFAPRKEILGEFFDGSLMSPRPEKGLYINEMINHAWDLKC